MNNSKELWGELCITKTTANIEKFKNITINGKDVIEEYQDVTVINKFKKEIDAKTYFNAMNRIIRKIEEIE